MNIIEIHIENYMISTDNSLLDVEMIHEFLTNESTWCIGIPYDQVRKAIDHSLNFGLYMDGAQIGFARVISDFSTIAYLGDIFILKEYRGLGLSKWLMEVVMAHGDLQNLRRWILLTSTAPWLYEKYGFNALPKPEIYMEKFNPDVYR